MNNSEQNELAIAKHFPGKTYDEIVKQAIGELIAHGAIRLHAETIQTYLSDHYGIWVNLGTIRAILADLASKGAFTIKRNGAQS